jgi:hypothetical protein
VNDRGKGFTNVAFLLGVAGEFDARSAVSGGLALDGLVDLVVEEDLGLKGQKLHIWYLGEHPRPAIRDHLESGQREGSF